MIACQEVRMFARSCVKGWRMWRATATGNPCKLRDHDQLTVVSGLNYFMQGGGGVYGTRWPWEKAAYESWNWWKAEVHWHHLAETRQVKVWPAGWLQHSGKPKVEEAGSWTPLENKIGRTFEVKVCSLGPEEKQPPSQSFPDWSARLW